MTLIVCRRVDVDDEPSLSLYGYREVAIICTATAILRIPHLGE